MVVLEALKCAQCGKQCDRALLDGCPYEISVCMDCDRLVCGKCTRKQLSCPRHPGLIRVTARLANFCIFTSYAPEDELRLIDLQVVMNDNCSACNCNEPTLDRHCIQQVLCVECRPHGSYWWTAWPTSSEERIFWKIISELNEHVMPKTRFQRNELDGMLPVQNFVTCTACNQDLDALRPIMFDGEPHCQDCTVDFPNIRLCDCVSRLIDLIKCIPENQLHLLTYSKWLKAVGCEQHRDTLYELNAVSADGTKTGKLRSFFKKEEIARTLNIRETSSIPNPMITVKTTVAANKIKPSTSTLTKLDPSIPDKLLPDRITCSCGRQDEVSNMFDCLTCSTYGMCGLCLGKKHWGHEMKESKKTVAFCLINSQSEATRQKLNEMVGQTKDLNKEGEQSFEKLCEVLGIVFKDAMNSDDLHRIQSLLTKANTSEIEVDFKNVMNSTRRLCKRIDSFCVDLVNAVEETEDTASIVKANPSTNQE